MPFAFDNTYARELEGLYLPWKGAPAPAPRVAIFNAPLAEELGLAPSDLTAAILCGAESPPGAAPLAQAYAGHQFGGFSPQLGDGRALLVGELIDTHGRRRDLHLKGSGRTPFSRGGDGKAVLGPMLREYLMGEAMRALNIPTTRALAVALTGETIFRNGEAKPGAVLARVASSHLRVGTFEFFAAHGDLAALRRLLDYAIRRHDPDLANHPAPALALLKAVAARQARLIALWMSVGFIHGVMNTDNMALSGETIDYGPCAFLDAYHPQMVFSSIDEYGRYAFGAQPRIAQWNLARFAEALLPLIGPDPEGAAALAEPVVNDFAALYARESLRAMGAKIGLDAPAPEDEALIDALLKAMMDHGLDFTTSFRALAAHLKGALAPEGLADWAGLWRARLAAAGRTPEAAIALMNKANPVYIPRNHAAEEALAAAEAGDMSPFLRLLEALRDPFAPRAGLEDLALPAPEGAAPHVTFCGT